MHSKLIYYLQLAFYYHSLQKWTVSHTQQFHLTRCGVSEKACVTLEDLHPQ